jgi:hypothetical protein
MEQLVTAECFRGMGDEVSQQRKLLCRKLQRFSGPPDLVAADVDLDITEAIDLKCLRG